jgi:hypothetical protein
MHQLTPAIIMFTGVFSCLLLLGCSSPTAPQPANLTTPEPVSALGAKSSVRCTSPDAAWIWCDDFEQDRLEHYFEHDRRGRFARVAGVGRDGSWGMRAQWSQAGQVNAGSLKLAFGRTPSNYIRPVDAGTADHQEVYWRVYVRTQPGWSGGGGHKLSRATSLVSGDWAQSMIAHVWSAPRPPNWTRLVLDPASGTTPGGELRAARYNDFDNLRWLGSRRGDTPLFADEAAGRWYCVEAGIRLNDPGLSNGWFRLWIDERLDAERTGLNWRGSFAEYGINAVFLENYWNGGVPQPQERYFDDFVVSTERIGC